MSKKYKKTDLTSRAKEEAKKLLYELNITKFNENNLGIFQDILDGKVNALVTAKECHNETIDEDLLVAYDLLTDIVIDYEEDLVFLNKLFFDL